LNDHTKISQRLIRIDTRDININVDYKKVKTIGDLRLEIKKAIKKVDTNYVREVIGAVLRRIYSVEKHNGELILDEHS
jgi:hypothetical protein